MNMIMFVLLALLAAVGILSGLAYARRESVSVDQAETQSVLAYKSAITQFDAELANATISQDQYDSLLLEAQHSLLQQQRKATRSVAGGRIWLVLVAVIIPLAAFAGYLKYGAMSDLGVDKLADQWAVQVSKGEAIPDPELNEIRQVVERALQHNPNQTRVLYFAAQVEQYQRNFTAAESYYERLIKLDPEDPAVAASLAQSAYFVAGGNLTPKVILDVDRALKLNPQSTAILAMMGMHYYQHGQLAQAIPYWESLLNVLPSSDPNYSLIAEAVAKAKVDIGDVAAKPGAEPAKERSIEVTVKLAKGLKFAPTDTVFIIAKAKNGPPAPLAARKIKVSQLPITVTLKASDAMMPGVSIDSFSDIVINARVSISGQPVAAKGDYEAGVKNLTFKSKAEMLKTSLTIANEIQ